MKKFLKRLFGCFFESNPADEDFLQNQEAEENQYSNSSGHSGRFLEATTALKEKMREENKVASELLKFTSEIVERKTNVPVIKAVELCEKLIESDCARNYHTSKKSR